jgi:hypothetical protein
MCSETPFVIVILIGGSNTIKLILQFKKNCNILLGKICEFWEKWLFKIKCVMNDC